MTGLTLYNNKGVLTKRAQLVSKKGIISFWYRIYLRI
jgi:hypothetical protein